MAPAATCVSRQYRHLARQAKGEAPGASPAHAAAFARLLQANDRPTCAP
jgi:hypothetical protein